jgi:hypothetical protein
MNSDNQEYVTRSELNEMREEFRKFREELQGVLSSTANDRKGLHIFRTVYEREIDMLIQQISEICSRIKLIEPLVYPKLGENLKQINNILKPPDNWEDPKLPSPPSSPPR